VLQQIRFRRHACGDVDREHQGEGRTLCRRRFKQQRCDRGKPENDEPDTTPFPKFVITKDQEGGAASEIFNSRVRRTAIP
jgi:hypothetical protein